MVPRPVQNRICFLRGREKLKVESVLVLIMSVFTYLHFRGVDLSGVLWCWSHLELFYAFHSLPTVAWPPSSLGISVIMLVSFFWSFFQFSGLHSSHCSNKVIKRICRKKQKEEQLDFKSLSNVPHLARSLLYRSTVSLCHTALFYLKLTLKINLRCALALCFFPLYLLLSTFLKFP